MRDASCRADGCPPHPRLACRDGIRNPIP